MAFKTNTERARRNIPRIRVLAKETANAMICLRHFSFPRTGAIEGVELQWSRILPLVSPTGISPSSHSLWPNKALIVSACSTVTSWLILILSAIVSEAILSNEQSQVTTDFFPLKAYLGRMINSSWPAFHGCTWRLLRLLQLTHKVSFCHNGASRGKHAKPHLCQSSIYHETEGTSLCDFHALIITFPRSYILRTVIHFLPRPYDGGIKFIASSC